MNKYLNVEKTLNFVKDDKRDENEIIKYFI